MSTPEWRKENTKRFVLQVTKKSGIPDALQKMEENTGQRPIEYIRKAVTESLEFDGYLKKEPSHPFDLEK